MPLNKRIVFDPASYHKKDVFEQSTSESFLQDHNMSRILGAVQQLAYFSSFSLELFQNLSILSEDLGERIRVAAVRTTTLYDELKSVDREVSSLDNDDHMSAVPGLAKYLQTREMFTPQLFNKVTNYSAISQQYRICRAPPQLWRVEVFTDEDCFSNFSNPGFFFQEWVRSEIIRQQYKKEERKRLKHLKKLHRQERKKQKEAAIEEDLYNTMYSSASVSASASANVSLSGLTNKRNKSMLAAKDGRSVDGDPRLGTTGAVPAVARSDAVRAEDEDGAANGWSAPVDDDGSVGEEEGDEEDRATGASKLAKKKDKKPKGGSAGTKAVKSASAGLAKLFNRKPKALFPTVDEEGEEPEPLPAAVPSAKKSESMAMQLLEVDAGHRRSEEEAERGVMETNRAAASAGQRDLVNSAARSGSGPVTGKPVSCLEELASGQGQGQGGREDGAFLQLSERDSLLTGGACPDAPPIFFQAVAPPRNKGAPVTMKIGSKFLSVAPPTGAKGAVASARTLPAAGDSIEGAGRGQESGPTRRRGSSTGNIVTESSAAGAMKTHSDSVDWETQRASSTGNLLVKPSPPPPPAGQTLAAAAGIGGKRASFSLDTKGAGSATGESRLLPNKHRASLVLSQTTAETIFDRNNRGLWGDSGDSTQCALGGGALRRRSLLSMLEEEVLEELAGQDRTSQQRDVSLFAASDVAEEPEPRAETREGSESEDSPPASDDDGHGDEEEFPTEEENEGSEEGDLPPSDDEADDETPPPRPSHVRPGGPPPPPPPPPPPASLPQPTAIRSPLSEGLLGALKSGAAGAALKRVEPPAEAARVDDRAQLLRSIQLGAVQLKSSAAAGNKPKPLPKIDVKQNEAVAAILANRSKIAGSDTESSDGSDSDYTDDDY